MSDIEERQQKAIAEITGNESLLGMLETEAATEMLEWGKSMVASLVKGTEDLDDAAAETELEPRLKAVRQTMRSVGNWAAGKYTDPEDRLQLRDKLLGHWRVIQGEDAPQPSPEQLDAVLNQMDVRQSTQQQLVLDLKSIFNEAL